MSFHTLSLFRRLYEKLPPLFPNKHKEKIKVVLDEMEKDNALSRDRVEKAMVGFGYIVWPWYRAYHEYLNSTEEKMADHFFLPKLTSDLQNKYNEFKNFGGHYSLLYSGNAANHFSPEERIAISEALVNVKNELREFVNREIAGLEMKNYLNKVDNYNKILATIQEQVRRLNEMANNETDYPHLANEIREKIKAIEHGLCFLGPELNHDEILDACSFFHGRKLDLNRMKGAHRTVQINFY